MKTHPFLLGALMSITVFLSACSTTYAPRAGAADPKLLPTVPSGKRIALINTQPSSERVLIGDAGMGRKVYGDLRAWTDNAITAIRKSLEKKGAVVNPSADKTLKVAVSSAEFGEAGGGWAFRATITFTIETGDGQKLKLGVEDNSWKFLNACDGAMEKLPVVALNDERVVKYLNQP